MHPNIMLLLAFGGIIQVGGVVYAFVGFDEVNLPLAIGAFVFGGLVELGGIVLILRKR